MTGATIFWLTGLSGAGKSTLAEAAKRRLEAEGWRVLVVDGDAVRRTMSRDLGFNESGIRRNNMRIAALCESKRAEADAILVPVIAPIRSVRETTKARLSPGFCEIYITAPITVLAARDVKGLYARAERGEIHNLIGVSPESPYEAPEAPDFTIDTSIEQSDESVERLYGFIRARLATIVTVAN